MKAFTTLLGLAAAVSLNAAVLTVSNEPGYPAQYTTLNDAHAAASAGDTLYVTPSATYYDDVIIDRPLTIIGGGYNIGGPSSTVNYIYLGAGADGSKVIGMNMYILYYNYFSTMTDVLIERCAVNSISYYNNYGMDGLLVKHCEVLTSINLGEATNVLITSNLIKGYVTGSSSPSVLISNNVFANSNGSHALQSISYAVISNNIFYGLAPSFDGYSVENCAFNNNMSFGSADDDLPPNGSNVGSGNLVGVDPLFVDVPDFTGNVSYDYHLQAASPGHNAGTDGSDLGLYGGGTPLNVPLDGRPRIPLVTNFVINTSTIAEGGSLNVTVEGRKND